MDTLVRRQIFLDNFMEFPLHYGGWAISEDILFDIIQYSLIARPTTILDLGTGSTTLALAKYASKMQEQDIDITIVSVDNDSDWLENTHNLLSINKLLKYVMLIHAPIVKTKYGLYYDFNKIKEHLKKNIDLMVIDGPPQATQKNARYPAMPFFEKYLSKTAKVFLDDGNRDDEKRIVKQWLDEFPNWSKQFRPYMKGGFILHRKDDKNANLIIPNHSSVIDCVQTDQLQKQKTQLQKQKTQLQRYLQTIGRHKTELSKLKLQQSQYIKQIKNIQTSKSYRLGNLLIKPFTKVYQKTLLPIKTFFLVTNSRKTPQK